MAGNKLESGETSRGVPLIDIVENGNVEPDDEWALYRLTDDGFGLYKEGADFASSITTILINGAPTGEEVGRCKSRAEAIEDRGKLSPEEKQRTLLRSVRPKT